MKIIIILNRKINKKCVCNIRLRITRNNYVKIVMIFNRQTKDVYKRQHIQYAIYRKQTSTNITIPNHSDHPPQHKMAAFHSLVNRMHKIP